VVVINHGISAFNGSLNEFKQLTDSTDLRQSFLHVIQQEAV
jgi:hypothetical protein